MKILVKSCKNENEQACEKICNDLAPYFHLTKVWLLSLAYSLVERCCLDITGLWVKLSKAWRPLFFVVRCFFAYFLCRKIWRTISLVDTGILDACVSKCNDFLAQDAINAPLHHKKSCNECDNRDSTNSVRFQI